MSQRKLSPTAIGIFVLGAVVLLIVGIMTVAHGEMFVQRVPFVACFGTSVSGLRTGAPVTYRGVTVGEVSEIHVELDPQSQTPIIPVFFELDPGRFQHMGDAKTITPEQVYKRINALIAKGLRARLKLDNYLTGQLSIELDFVHDDVPTFRNPATSRHGHTIPEFPTALGDFDELMGQLKNLPLAELFAKLDSIATGLNKLVSSDDTKGILKNLNETTAKFPGVVDTLHNEIPLLTKQLRSSLMQVSDAMLKMGRAFEAVETLADNIDSKVDPSVQAYFDAAAEFKTTFAEAQKTLKTIQAVVDNADKSMLAEDSKLQTEMVKTLKELQKTIRSANVLAEYLQRHPEALLKGKKGH